MIQDHQTGKWTQKGLISGLRTADDGSTQSYTITMNDWGNDVIRNKRFIKHDIYGPASAEYGLKMSQAKLTKELFRAQLLST